jgi:hypothetical protein
VNFQRIVNRGEAHLKKTTGFCSEESSHFRELLNLVEALEIKVREGTFGGAEAVLFTDNSMAAAVFCKGNSSSNKKLFELAFN